MVRVKIETPAAWLFSTEIPVRITDINYGNHMGNDAFLGIVHEARMRWLRQYGWTELLFDKVGLIMVDIAVRFKSLAVYGDTLTVSVAPAELTRLGFDLLYLAVKKATGEEVARARTGMIFFDYAKNKMTPMPEAFRSAVAG
jgi:acyl-CoA thioester hydrolase